MAELHGQDPNVADERYDEADNYSGDDRVVRVLSFAYTVAVEDPSGLKSIEVREAHRGDTVTLEQIGLIAQTKGEKAHSFYTDEEREALEEGRDPDAPEGSAGASGSISEMGEYELAEYIKEQNLTVGDTVALAGTDKDLAHRVLQAENIATDGEPRKGVEAGLTAIIEG